jgi:ABC-2 type transport system permease protein
VSGRAAIGLVARREVVERTRERSFLVSTLFTLAILAAIVVLPTLLGLGEDEQTVAVASPQGERVLRAAQPGAEALDLELEVRRAGSEAEARGLVAGGDADAALVGPRGGRVRILVQESLDEQLASVLQGASAALRTQAALARHGLDASERRAVLRQAPLPVSELEPDGGGQAQGLAIIALLLLFFQLVGYGYWTAAGIVEEKASRVVELLLSAVRPRDLLAGKVLGIGAVALGQLLLVSLCGLALALVAGSLDVPEDAVGALLVVLGFFVLGYAFYAALFAVAGALVPRQEEVQNATTPITVVLFAAYFLAFQAAQEPEGGLAQGLSLFPPTAAIVLPVRIIAGDVPAWEVAAGVLLLLAAAAALLLAAGRIYANAVLRTGGRIKLADAWRSAP